jgi:hypothetical protein
MIFPPVPKRTALYHRLLTDTMLVRTPTRIGERGHSFIYAASNAVVRHRPHDSDIYRAAAGFQDEMRACLAPAGPASVMPADGSYNTIIAAAKELHARGHYKTMLFEGYLADSAREHAALFEALDAEFSTHGVIVIRPARHVADTWNNKTKFVDYVRDAYGPSATVPGEVLPVAPIEAIVAKANEYLELSGQAILKIAGMGGFGNLMVTRADAAEGSVAQQLSAFLQRRPEVDEVRVESWVTWNQTLCCSFFIDENGDPIPLDVCGQILSRATAGFMGSYSHIDLSLDDRQALQDIVKPFMSMVAADGMRGFLGVDMILSEPSGLPDELRLPVSQQAVRLVEANMRINGHNQDRLCVAQIAARHQRDADRIHHLKVGANPVRARDRSEAIRLVAAALDGVAAPLAPHFDPGSIYYIVTECLGEGRGHRNDNVMFVGEDVTLDKFEDAISCLRAPGLLKE